jgi:hypothetical protein
MKRAKTGDPPGETTPSPEDYFKDGLNRILASDQVCCDLCKLQFVVDMGAVHGNYPLSSEAKIVKSGPHKNLVVCNHTICRSCICKRKDDETPGNAPDQWKLGFSRCPICEANNAFHMGHPHLNEKLAELIGLIQGLVKESPAPIAAARSPT